MMTHKPTDSASQNWNGVNRRVRYDCRMGGDRRTLLRFETLACDRRLGTPRRKSEMIWEREWFSRAESQ